MFKRKIHGMFGSTRITNRHQSATWVNHGNVGETWDFIVCSYQIDTLMKIPCRQMFY